MQVRAMSSWKLAGDSKKGYFHPHAEVCYKKRLYYLGPRSHNQIKHAVYYINPSAELKHAEVDVGKSIHGFWIKECYQETISNTKVTC